MGSAAEAATIDLVAAYREEDFAEKVRNLELTMDFLQQDKDSHFTAKRTEDQIKLLAIQRVSLKHLQIYILSLLIQLIIIKIIKILNFFILQLKMELKDV